MEFLIVWLSTVVLSIGMEVGFELQYYKDLADNGYKINNKKLSQISNEIGLKKVSLMKHFIPFINMMSVIQNTMNYKNNRELFFKQLELMDAIEEMNNYEKREYKKNPRGLNAIIVPLKYDVKLKKADKVIVSRNEENDKSEVYFTLEHHDINILKATGSLERESLDIQKQAVRDVLGCIRNSSNSEFIEMVKNGVMEDNTISNDEKQKIIEALDNLKENSKQKIKNKNYH